MVELRVFSASASASYQLRRFPCLIGRAADADLRIEEPGVWDRHLQIELNPDQGFEIGVLPDAHATLNGQPLERARLRNGDLIEAGAVKFQFWLSEPIQRRLRAREWFTWVSLALLCAAQIALIYLLVY